MGQIVGKKINKNHREHEHDGDLHPPVSMGTLQKVMARMLMVPRLGSLALYIVLMYAHLVPIIKRKKTPQSKTSGVQMRRVSLYVVIRKLDNWGNLVWANPADFTIGPRSCSSNAENICGILSCLSNLQSTEYRHLHKIKDKGKCGPADEHPGQQPQGQRQHEPAKSSQG